MPIHIVYELDTLACKARGNFGRNHNLIIGLLCYTVLISITGSVKPQRARFGTIPTEGHRPKTGELGHFQLDTWQDFAGTLLMF